MSFTIAGCCCAHLLHGVPVRITQAARARVPAIVVSQATQALIEDVFQRAGVFQGLPEIDRRIVKWGRGDPVEVPHAAAIISEQVLTERLQPAEWKDEAAAEWTIHAAGAPGTMIDFGSRRAYATAVDMQGSACWVESLDHGWLFLIPGWLIAVGGQPRELLGESELVASQIAGSVGEAAEFPAWPRIADPLCAAGWLACGSAAMAFDPICGDGTGNAVREAVLASAVIRAVRRGEDVEALLAHYRTRLIAGFRRHLEMALQFYRAGNRGPWWDQEIRAMERGVTWCSGELANAPEFRYALRGFELVRTSEPRP